MGEAIRIARAVGGLIMILVLAAMLLSAFMYPSIDVQPTLITTTVMVIGALLGLDKLLEYGPLQIQIGNNKNGENGEQ